MAAPLTTGMRDRDAKVFRDSAKLHALYLLTRHANAESLKYIGVRGYVPKPFYIKSKTARSHGAVKNGRLYELAGLVVDPDLHPELYEGPRLEQARARWAGDALRVRSGQAHGVSMQVDRNPASKHYGCLQLRGSAHVPFAYVHCDYDLKDIIEKGYESYNERVVGERWGLPHYEVRLRRTDVHELIRALNGAMGAAMVQHGSEAQFAGHSEDAITTFLPDGRLEIYEDAGIVDFYARLHRDVHAVAVDPAETRPQRIVPGAGRTGLPASASSA